MIKIKEILSRIDTLKAERKVLHETGQFHRANATALGVCAQEFEAAVREHVVAQEVRDTVADTRAQQLTEQLQITKDLRAEIVEITARLV